MPVSLLAEWLRLMALLVLTQGKNENHVFQTKRASFDLRPCKMKIRTPWEPTNKLKSTWKTNVSSSILLEEAARPSPQPSPKTTDSPMAMMVNRFTWSKLPFSPLVSLADRRALRSREVIMTTNMIQSNM